MARKGELFWQETELVEQTKALLETCESKDYVGKEDFEKLLKGYSELLLQTKKLTRHGDKQQQRLNNLLERISRYVSPPLYKKITQGKERVEINRTRRVKLTIFFSDIKDFSTHSANMEPEALSAILNSYLEEMTSIINKYNGTLDKYIGDAIMVFFGDPDYVNDYEHAKRCVAMALAMRSRMLELKSLWLEMGHPTPLQIRMGIATGYVSVGNFGSSERMDYTIIGSPVNLASRLQEYARDNQILVSHETWAYVKDIVDCKAPLTLDNLKGFPKGIIAHELRGLKADNQGQCVVIEDKSRDLFIRYNPTLSCPEDILALLQNKNLTN